MASRSRAKAAQTEVGGHDLADSSSSTVVANARASRNAGLRPFMNKASDQTQGYHMGQHRLGILSPD